MATKPKGAISLKTFGQLIDRDLMRFAGDEDEMLTARQRRGDVQVWVYTAEHTYWIRAQSRGATRLECWVMRRRQLAGEVEPCGYIQLTSGPLTRRTWQEIKNDMLSTEMVPLGYPEHGRDQVEQIKAEATGVLIGAKARHSLTARPIDRRALAELRRRIG